LVVPEQKYKKNYDLLDGEKPYPTMTLENSGSNSLKEQNPEWAEQKLFTNKMDEIQLKSNFKPFTLPGKTKEMEYTIEFDEIDIPSEEDPLGSGPEIPTQMNQLEHNSTVYKTASEKHAVECVACGHRMNLSEAEMDTAECPKSTKKEDKEAAVVVDPSATVKISSNDSKKVIALETARIKTAFSCSSKLAVAGIIDANEIDSYADQMLNDGLKADAMIRQTKLLLKSSQTNTERVVAAAAERMQNVRTASTMGISTSPAFSGGLSSNGAALDIQAALKGTWSMPQIED
jgi:Zn ribbon nucleic-acid-binding protein